MKARALFLLLAALPIAHGQLSSTPTPSLQETLDWIKEKTPLASNHYVLQTIIGTKDVNMQTTAVRFESCTVVFDIKEVDTWEAAHERPIANTTRFTVPLGAITGGSVMEDEIVLSPSPGSKAIQRWTVYLDASSKVVLEETQGDLHNTTKTESSTFALMSFLISASIFGRSSGVNFTGRSMS